MRLIGRMHGIVGRLAVAALLIGIPAAAGTAEAALIQLRPQCTATSTVVRLADIADIQGADVATAQRLASIVFQPAPGVGRQSQLRMEDVKSRLQALGENLTALELRGAAVVEIRGPQPEREAAPMRFSNNQFSQAEKRVVDAIQQHLDTHAPQLHVAAVGLPSAEEAQELLNSNTAYWRLAPRQPLATGRLSFVINTTRPEGNRAIEVSVDLAYKPRLLVLRHGVEQGHVIDVADLAWMPVMEIPRHQTIVNDPQAVVGREATRALLPGRPLTEKDVRRSLLIKRGDTVTIYSRFGAVSIKTVARALDEGAYGDQISLRVLDNQKTIVARVIDFHIAEVTPEMSQPGQGSAGFRVHYQPAGIRAGQTQTYATTAAQSPPRR